MPCMLGYYQSAIEPLTIVDDFSSSFSDPADLHTDIWIALQDY